MLTDNKLAPCPRWMRKNASVARSANNRKCD